MLNIAAPDHSHVYLNGAALVDVHRTKSNRGTLSVSKIWLRPETRELLKPGKNLLVLDVPDASKLRMQELSMDMVWADKLNEVEESQ